MNDSSQTAPTALRRVLIATDFSPHASQAVARATKLPLAAGARMRLLHVAPDRDTLANGDVHQELEREGQRLQKRLDAKTTTKIAVGDAAIEIVRAARAYAAELVVLGAHTKRGLFGLGSTPREVIRHASCPVLVVKRPAPRPYRRPLIAVDLSDVSRSVMDAARVVLHEDASLRLVHAYGRGARDRDDARQRVAAFLASTGRCAATVRQGDPRDVIAAEVARRDSDLLALGTQGRTGLARLLQGSVAEHMLQNATCDVLVIPPQRPSTESLETPR